MPVREQFAWVWLTTLIVVYAAYFTAVALVGSSPDQPFLLQFQMFGAAAVAQMIILGVAVLLLKRPRPGQPKVDERDHAIEHRSSAMAYYVLIAGMIIVGCLMPFDKSKSAWDFVHAAVFAIVAAEIVHQAMVVISYRRGWNG